MTAAVVNVLMGKHPCCFQIYDMIRCEICRNYSIDFSCNVCFECHALDTLRNNLCLKMIHSMPDCVKLHFESIVPREKTIFLLLGFQQT